MPEKPAPAPPIAAKPIPPVAAKSPTRRSALPWFVAGVLVTAGGAAATYWFYLRPKLEQRIPPTVGKADTENLPPQVTSFVAKASRIEAGSSTVLTATITDPEKDPYYAWWTTSCGVIAPRTQDQGTAIFLAPSTPGPCAVTLEVQDHEQRRTRRLQYTVTVQGGG